MSNYNNDQTLEEREEEQILNEDGGASEFSEAEEAIEEDEVDEVEEEDDGEDLFHDDMMRDYAPQPELDRYDPNLVDDATYDEMDVGARRRAEREMSRRDAEAAGDDSRPGVPNFSGLEDFLGDDEDDDAEDEVLRRRRRRERFRATAERASRPLPREAEQAKDELPFCNSKTTWNETIEEILRRVVQGFIWFYKKSEEEGVEVRSDGDYAIKIADMVRAGSCSIILDWNDLSQYCGKLTDYIMLIPTPVFAVIDFVLTEITQELFPQLYAGTNINCRLTGFMGIESLRNLRTDCLNQLVAVEGVCIRRTNVFPRLKLVYLECVKCGCDMNGPFEQKENKDMPKRRCQECQSNGPFFVNREKTVYENFQKLVMQEPPGSVAAGHVPRQREVVVLGDLVDLVRPGDDVMVTGIYQTKPDAGLNAKTGFPIFATQIIANNVQRKGDIKLAEMTEKDVDTIKKLSRNPHVREKIIDSIAPSIWGLRHVKTAMAYAMFGGVRRQTAAKHTVRGDINVLVLGDPGMAKSQFLKYVEKTFDRTVYTTGKGASAVGLTAAVKRDPMSGEWTLEGGALVLADEGICLIDEFDKMSDKDRVSIHEAMEQQSISISKAGIVTSLRARCSVVAAANPIFGRYDNALTFTENVDLSDPILSRFDVLAVLKDQVNPIQDEYLADYVVESHMKSHPDLDPVSHARMRRNVAEEDVELENEDGWINGTGRIPQEILKKYIFYARKNSFPEMRTADQTKLAEFYSQIRQAAVNSGGIPMTVRHLESILRMATANAKMRLSRYVEKRDLDFAISTMLESFIQSQKFAVATNLSRRFGRYRALAASPNEFIETLLSDLLNRKGREAVNRALLDGAEFAVDDIHHFDSAVVSFAALKTLARNLHDIPEQAVAAYIESDKFRARFTANREDKEIMLSRKGADFDNMSQGSQESQPGDL